MSIVEISIPGQPVAWGRARISRSGMLYTPQKTRKHENMVKSYAQVAMNGALPFGGPVRVIIESFMAIPKSWSIRKVSRAVFGEIKPITRPDLDNITKAILDALNQTVFVDDSQVVEISATKHYAILPSTEIRVIEL